MYWGTVPKVSSAGVTWCDEDRREPGMGDTSNPAEPPSPTTTLLAEFRTSQSSGRRPLRSVLAS